MSLQFRTHRGPAQSHPVSRTIVPTTEEAERASFLEELYHAHADRVFGLCLRMSGDRTEALELAQDVFVRAWQKLDHLEPGMDSGAWLWRLATDVVLNTQRAHRRRVARIAHLEHPAELERLDLRTPAPVRQLSFDAAVARLPERARAVFLLHDVEGYGQGEIAAMLDAAEGAVRAQLHRARTLMREALR